MLSKSQERKSVEFQIVHPSVGVGCAGHGNFCQLYSKSYNERIFVNCGNVLASPSGIRGTMTVSLSGMSLALSLCFAAGVGYMFAVFSSAPVDGVGGGGGGGGARRDAVVVNTRPSSHLADMPSATTSAATTAAMQRSSTSPQCVRPRPAIQIAPRSWSRRAVKCANFTQREVSTEAHAQSPQQLVVDS
jgi:hypothetical protein